MANTKHTTLTCFRNLFLVFSNWKQKSQSSETQDTDLLCEAKSLVNCDNSLPCDNTIGLVLEHASGEPPEPGKVDNIILPSILRTETIKYVCINRICDYKSR